MDHAKHTMLIATATSEVASWLMSKVDFNAELKISRAEMETIGAKLGLSSTDALRGHDDLFDMLMKGKIVTHCEQKAAAEVAEAINEAAMEVERYKVRLSDLQVEHNNVMADIAKSLLTSAPEDEDFVDFIKSSKTELHRITQKFHDDMLRMFQERHRLELHHCFTGHLVPEPTANQLVDLYEAK